MGVLFALALVFVIRWGMQFHFPPLETANVAYLTTWFPMASFLTLFVLGFWFGRRGLALGLTALVIGLAIPAFIADYLGR